MDEAAHPGPHLGVLVGVAQAVVADPQSVRQVCNIEVTVGDTHLPGFFLDGKLYIQAPIRHVVEAIAAEISLSVRNLEVGIYTEGNTALSLDRNGRPVPRKAVAKQDVV